MGLLDLLHHTLLRIEVGLNVSLCRPKIGMAGQNLNIAERSAHARYLACRVRYERPSSAVA